MEWRTSAARQRPGKNQLVAQVILPRPVLPQRTVTTIARETPLAAPEQYITGMLL